MYFIETVMNVSESRILNNYVHLFNKFLTFQINQIQMTMKKLKLLYHIIFSLVLTQIILSFFQGNYAIGQNRLPVMKIAGLWSYSFLNFKTSQKKYSRRIL